MLRSAAIVIDRAWSAVSAVGVVESVARTVKLDVPALVGVPEMTPVVPFSDSPPGNVPLTIVQLIGAFPPDEERVCVYAEFTTPFGAELVVTSKLAAMAMLRLCVSVSAVGLVLSVARTEKFDVPAEVGVPDITPAPLSESPAGRLPLSSVQDTGTFPPVAVSV